MFVGQIFDTSCYIVTGTQYIGFKCKLCSFSCHEDCLNTTGLSGYMADCLHMQHILSQSGGGACLSQLDTSAYSMVNTTSSSCSTTPNSYYSQTGGNNWHGQPANHTNKSFNLSNSNKLDTDIGSASGKHPFMITHTS